MTAHHLRFTQEQRIAWAKKSVATRRANKEKREELKAQALERTVGLRDEIEALEKRLADLKRMEAMQVVSCAVTGKALLREEEIVKASSPWERASGVYFLVSEGRVVYVGQSVCIHSRLHSHAGKAFDRYAYVPCPAEMMDKLESLYIHLLRPERNANVSDNQKYAPIPLDKLLGSTVKEKNG